MCLWSILITKMLMVDDIMHQLQSRTSSLANGRGSVFPEDLLHLHKCTYIAICDHLFMRKYKENT